MEPDPRGLRLIFARRDERKFEPSLTDAKGFGIPAMMNFARTLMVDIQAIRNAVIEPWSNG
jgi:transposase